MGLFANLFQASSTRDNKLSGIRLKIESFLRPSTALVDSRDLTIPEKRERYALYVYGAILALGKRQDLNVTEALAVLVMVLEGQGMHPRDASHLVNVCINRSASDDGLPYLEAGESALQEWLEGNAGSAVSRLAKVMH